MPRKYAVLSASMLTVALTITGISMAAVDGPLEKQMEAINVKTRTIKNSIKTVAAWKKDAKNAAKGAEEIIRLGKEARKEKGPSEKQKKTYDEWTKLMDDMIKAAEDFSAVAKNPQATQVQAKDAFKAVDKSCASCHTVFRVDEDK
jgi:cytochrome c556